jgi:ribokinase
MSGRRIVVVGSINIDLMLRCPRLPQPGETVQGDRLLVAPGGKGANQAVAASRLGATVSMIGCIGRDDFGAQALAALQSDGGDTRFVARVADEPASGVAVVLSDATGENSIALAPGANRALGPEHIDAAHALWADAALLVCQLEVRLATVAHALRMARRHGVPTLLNPAPAQPLSADILRSVDLLVPNRGEAALLLGEPLDSPPSALRAAQRLQRANGGQVVVTLGSDGVALADGDAAVHQPARTVRALDTTGAGDTFVGALAAERVRGASLGDAVVFAQAAAAYSVMHFGAQAAMPRRGQVAL